MNQNQIKLNKPIKSILSYGQRYCNLLEKYQSWDQTFSRYHENGFIIFLSLLSAMYSLITPSSSCEITLLLNLEPKWFCLSLQTSLNKCKGWFGLMHCEGEIQFIFTYTFYFASRIGKKTTKKNPSVCGCAFLKANQSVTERSFTWWAITRKKTSQNIIIPTGVATKHTGYIWQKYLNKLHLDILNINIWLSGKSGNEDVFTVNRKVR